MSLETRLRAIHLGWTIPFVLLGIRFGVILVPVGLVGVGLASLLGQDVYKASTEIAEYIIGIFLFLIVACVYIAVVVLGSYFAYDRVRRKGYRPPSAVSILLFGGAVGITGAVAIFPEHPAAKTVWPILDIVCVPLLLSAAGLTLIILVLPRRKARDFGERRGGAFLLRIGQVLILLEGFLLVVASVAWIAGNHELAYNVTGAFFVGFVVLVPTAIYLIQRGKSQLLMDELIRNDPRPPVIYLRAFKQESQFFVIGPKSQYGQWAQSLHAALAEAQQDIGITLEEYLGQEITKSIGPFLALGSPEDYMTPPGAARQYAKDEEWKIRLDELVHKAACIIVELSKSDNLRWEFENLRSEGLQEILYIVTRPTTTGRSVGWDFWRVLWRSRGVGVVTWPELSGDLGKLGYTIDFDDPGPGAVVGFDAHGEGLVLTTGANSPTEFIDPILRSITSRPSGARSPPIDAIKQSSSE